MATTLNYERDKSTTTNTTGMAITAKADEGSSPTPADLAGDDGIIHFEYECDADESGGATLVNLFKGTLQVQISSQGLIKLLVNVTQVAGDGTETALAETEYKHTQNMDAWQTAAGRAKQA